MSGSNGDRENSKGRGLRYFVRGLSLGMVEAAGVDSGDAAEILVMFLEVQEPHARRTHPVKLMFPPGTENELKRLVNIVISDG